MLASKTILPEFDVFLLKVLSNEIGEDVNIQSLLNGETTWRGRQQQIVHLQNKVIICRFVT